MFPLRDENPTTHASVVTFVIIGLNLLTWVFVQGLGFGDALVNSVWRYGLLPAELLGRIQPGAQFQVGPGLVLVSDGQPNYASLITSMFMHGGWFHILGNLWFLAVFGDNVEDSMGSYRFAFFYLLCGLAAAGAQIAMDPSSHIPMVGASGAISGVMGAYAALYPRAPVHVLVFLGFYVTRVVVPAFLMLGYWFVLQILGGLPSLASSSGGVAFWAHIGGFIGGILLIRLFCRPDRVEACRARRGRADRYVRRASPGWPRFR